MNPNRMFGVIVIGGIAMVADSACGGSVSPSADAATDAKADAGAPLRFETAEASDGCSPYDVKVGDACFPGET
ncbi:MAG: hypothetical protein ACLP1X_31275 [Polyangiaceae bacterium]